MERMNTKMSKGNRTNHPIKNLAERFWAKVEKTESCWLWKGADNGTGYGIIGAGARNRSPVYAHRLSFELMNGPIEDGLTIDHLCRNRGCVNPEHLEAITQRENVLRGELGRRKTHCPKGHLLSGDNLSKSDMKKGHRRCRICYNEWMRERRVKIR
jgi:hypothetical protein